MLRTDTTLTINFLKKFNVLQKLRYIMINTCIKMHAIFLQILFYTKHPIYILYLFF